jgi:hypothetical protein
VLLVVPALQDVAIVSCLQHKFTAQSVCDLCNCRSWYQSKQRPALAKAFRESFLPFWVGSGAVSVEVRGAEVGHDHLVTR